MCALSSGAEAKTILPKKEKLKLRRERWLQSKCIRCLLAVTWFAHSQEGTGFLVLCTFRGLGLGCMLKGWLGTPLKAPPWLVGGGTGASAACLRRPVM